MIMPAAVTRQSEIWQAVAEVEQTLKPDVVFIHYDIRPACGGLQPTLCGGWTSRSISSHSDRYHIANSVE